MKFSTTTWGELRPGATILCPVDQQPERVTFARPSPRGKRHVRTERHDHIRPVGQCVRANNDTGRRDATYRTKYGTAVLTRPAHRAPWWLHLPAAWPRHDRQHMPTSRQNSQGAFFFRSQRAAEQWLAGYIELEQPGVAGNRLPRRAPGTPPLRRGVYT